MRRPAAGTESRPSRIERRRNRKVEEILAATAELLAERGYHDTSLEAVADRIDVSKASLYYYFPSREALVAACLDAVGREMIRELREIASEESGTPRDRLEALIEHQLNLTVHRSPQLAAMFRQPDAWPESYGERLRELRRDHHGIFTSVVRAGVASGELAVEDETVAMHNLFGALNYVPVWYRPRRKAESRKTSRAIVDSLVRLFLPPAPRR